MVLRAPLRCKRPFIKKNGSYIWPCTVCKMPVFAKSIDKLQSKRSAHIRGAHPDLSQSKFVTLGGRMGRLSPRGCRKLNMKKSIRDGIRDVLAKEGSQRQPGPLQTLHLASINTGGQDNASACLHSVCISWCFKRFRRTPSKPKPCRSIYSPVYDP